MSFISRHNIPIRFVLAIAGVAMTHPLPTQALPLDTYTSSSVLNDGNWVKVSVAETGIYHISSADLRNWGFSDPTAVKVYGYGGQRLPDRLDSDYIDDLPIVQSLNTDNGIFFYGVGVETWGESQTSGRYDHTLNPYSSVGYYYLSDRDVLTPEIPTAGIAQAQNPATTFNDRLFHETNTYSIGHTGHLLLGEDFKYTSSQTFNFTLTDKADDESDVWMECSFVAKTYSGTSRLTFTANGEQMSHLSSDDIPSSSSTDVYGSMVTTRHTFSVSGTQLSLGINYSSSVTIYEARLNYIDINYTRTIRLNNGQLRFWTNSTNVSLANADASTHVWDVTDPLHISSMNIATSGSSVVWENEYTGMRTYMAWNENATLPSPTYVKAISNQNLHALDTPDMVIFTVEDWKAQAERIAELHRSSVDAMQVVVVTLDEVYNEFSSGVPDANAFRKMLKMMWDRGNETGQPLRFALFLGRMTYDNQHVTSSGRALGYPTIPNWQTDAGLQESESYATDDMFAFLQDNSGDNLSSDYLCIGVGRMPVRSVSEAKNAVDKLYSYVNSSRQTEWKNQIMLVADDMNNGTHMTQSEAMYEELLNTPSGSDFFYNKVYIDAFTRVSNSYPEARNKMFRLLDEGVLWWNYVGHASETTWTAEGLLTYTDINNLYLRNYPVLYAATCDFMKWDGDDLCGCEILFHNTNGGVIAAISATRQVYIADNGLLTNAIGLYVFARDDNGLFLPIGEIYRKGKNELKSNSNKLRYALMGDPAMRFAAPAPVAVLETIDGETVDPDKQITIKAKQNVTFCGSIYDEAGNKMNGFNGIISSTLYDAEKSTTSNGYSSESSDGTKITFEEQGDKLYSGRDSVINGEFIIKVSMPSEISENFRPAAFNMYAYADDGSEAIGCNRDFYVYGYDDTADEDTEPPVIDYLYLNHESFTNNSTVNESPMVIASVTDNVGINLSSAGIGHQMTIYLDDNTRYTDVSLYYTPALENSASGTIAYPLEGLSDGNHSLRLKVWDTSGNSAESTIDFFVKAGVSPIIYDVYTDVNPASTEVNFYLSHNRPDATITVTISVYDLMGRTVWSDTTTGQSDMFTTSPVTWDLCNSAGQRVQRGIYIYRASITTDGTHYATAAKKLAVTAP